jgi:hypothetical protein
VAVVVEIEVWVRVLMAPHDQALFVFVAKAAVVVAAAVVDPTAETPWHCADGGTVIIMRTTTRLATVVAVVKAVPNRSLGVIWTPSQ